MYISCLLFIISTKNSVMRAIIIIMAALLMVGCKTTQTIVEKPVYIHDTTQSVRVERDSVYVDRWHTIEVKGDTVYVTDSVWVVRKYRTTDTAYKYIEKPVNVEVTKIQEVTKPLGFWRKLLIYNGIFWLLVVGVYFGFKFWRKF